MPGDVLSTTRARSLVLGDLPLTIAEIPPESRRWRRQSEETSRGCKPRLSNPFDFFDHTAWFSPCQPRSVCPTHSLRTTPLTPATNNVASTQPSRICPRRNQVKNAGESAKLHLEPVSGRN